MGDASQEPVLRRKVGARRASLGIAEMTPSKAMRLALAKVGDAVLQVPVGLRDLSIGTISPDGLQEALPDPALILQLVAETGETGLVVVCPQAVAASIEAQTLGRVSEAAAADRKPTATDASLSKGFAEQVLGAFAMIAEECSGLPGLDGFKVGPQLPDTRVAAMMIEDVRHNHFVVEADFSGGAKTGKIHYILPNRTRKARAKTGEEPLAKQLERAIMSSKAQLEAQLCKITLPLSVAQGFHVGQVLPLNETTLDSVTLHALDGRKILSGRLGKSGSLRAIRLHDGEKAPSASVAAAAAGDGMGALMAPAEPSASMGEAAPMADLDGFGDAGGDLAPMGDMPGIDEPSPMSDLGGLPDLGGDDLGGLDTTPLDDLPATLDPMPLALDLPE